MAFLLERLVLVAGVPLFCVWRLFLNLVEVNQSR